MKNTALLSTILVMFSLSLYAQKPEAKEGWNFSLGGGAVYAPKYSGDDDYQLSFFPSIKIKYEDKFFASVREGIGYNVINSEGWRIGPILKYNFGRDDDGDSSFGLGSDTDDLEGLGDVDGTMELGAFIAYDYRFIGAKLEVRHGLGGGHEGLVGEASVRLKGRLKVKDKMIFYSIGPKLIYRDQNYTDAYFDVDQGQSIRSGLSQHDVDDGTLSYGLGATVIIPVTDSITTVCTLSYTRLGSETANSSLVEERGSANQLSLGVFVEYSF